MRFMAIYSINTLVNTVNTRGYVAGPSQQVEACRLRHSEKRVLMKFFFSIYIYIRFLVFFEGCDYGRFSADYGGFEA